MACHMWPVKTSMTIVTFKLYIYIYIYIYLNYIYPDLYEISKAVLISGQQCRSRPQETRVDILGILLYKVNTLLKLVKARLVSSSRWFSVQQ